MQKKKHSDFDRFTPFIKTAIDIYKKMNLKNSVFFIFNIVLKLGRANFVFIFSKVFIDLNGEQKKF
jgi:hypothetical protein